MDTVDFSGVCHETLQFLQEFIDSVHLNLTVTAISETEFEALVRDNRSSLNWRGYFSYYLSVQSFHIAFKITGSGIVDGAMLAVYSTSHKELHLLLLESLIHHQQHHPLKGRLTVLTIIAATFLLSLIDDSKGAWIVEPAPWLIDHYKRFGFTLYPGGKNVMYATTETLQMMQTDLLNMLHDRSIQDA